MNQQTYARSTIQPIEPVEGILRQNLTLISRAPYKCLQNSDIENQFGLPRMRPGIYIEMPDVLVGWNKGPEKGAGTSDLGSW
jgi:hypothetical protein